MHLKIEQTYGCRMLRSLSCRFCMIMIFTLHCCLAWVRGLVSMSTTVDTVGHRQDCHSKLDVLMLCSTYFFTCTKCCVMYYCDQLVGVKRHALEARAHKGVLPASEATFSKRLLALLGSAVLSSAHATWAKLWLSPVIIVICAMPGGVHWRSRCCRYSAYHCYVAPAVHVNNRFTLAANPVCAPQSAPCALKQ